MGQIRKNESFLRRAELDIIDITPQILMFERTNSEGSAIITINRTPEERKIILPSKKVYTLKKSTKKELSPYGAITIKKD